MVFRHFISPIKGLQDLNDNKVLSMKFKDPSYPKDHIFQAKLLPGAKYVCSL